MSHDSIRKWQAVLEDLVRCRGEEQLLLSDFLQRHPELEAALTSAGGVEQGRQENQGQALDDVTLTPPPPPPDTLHDETIVHADNRAPQGEAATQSAEKSLAAQAAGRFGNYELLEEIARGGMGVVYRARQIDLDRVVALKMILAGQLAGTEDVQRFRAEAQAAANLDHPGIVPIYEVGVQDGQHFFSMGFVEGRSLADVLKDGPLPPETAATIVKSVAEAVQYAHENQVIHRDLKPHNILLSGREPGRSSGEISQSLSTSDASSRPKVTDFGLAKRIDDASELTTEGQILGTPSYMPPEQAAGRLDTIGPLADVYALGAVLYAAVTGRPPFQSDNPMDTLLQVLEKEPLPPRALDSTIPRDLETICLKCLDKEPARRYASAADLAADLDRFLQDTPILARPTGPIERTRKWVRRRPAIASLIAAVALSLIIGTAVSSYFAVQSYYRAEAADQSARIARRATRQAQQALQAETVAKNQARQAIGNYVSVVADDQVLREARFQPLRGRLLADARRYYNELLDQTRQAELSRVELAEALMHVGDINTATSSLEEAIAAYQRASSVYEELAQAEPGRPEVVEHLGSCYNNLGLMYRQVGRLEDARSSCEKAIRLFEAAHQHDPQDDVFQQGLADSWNSLANVLEDMGDAAAALDGLQRAIDLRQELLERGVKEDAIAVQVNLAHDYDSLALLYRRRSDFSQAAANYDRALHIRQALVDADPANPRHRDNLAGSHNNLGRLHEITGQPEKAQAGYRQALAEFRAIAAANPHVTHYRISEAGVLYNLASLSERTGDSAAARSQFAQVLAIRQQLAEEHEDVHSLQFDLAYAYAAVARTSPPEEAERAERLTAKSMEIVKRLAELQPPVPQYQQQWARWLTDEGIRHAQAGDMQAAENHFQQAADVRQRLAEQSPDQAHLRSDWGGALNNLARAQMALQQWDAARQSYEQAIDLQQSAFRELPDNGRVRQFLSNHWSGLAELHLEQGDVQAAAEANGQRRQLWPSHAGQLYAVARDLAACANAVPDEDKAGYQAQALECLAAAIDAGFNDRDRLAADEAFRGWQDQDAFRQLLQRLQ